MKCLDLLHAVHEHRVSSHSVQTLAFCPRADQMATGDIKRRMRVWYHEMEVIDVDLRSHNEKIRPTERIRGISFSPDGAKIYAACGDLVTAYDVLSRSMTWSYRPPRSFGFLIISPMGLAVSPTGRVAATMDNGTLAVWDEEGRDGRIWKDNEAPRLLCFDATGDRIIGSDSFSLCLWDWRARKKVMRIPYRERIFGMTYCASTNRIAVRSFSHIDILDAESLQSLTRLPTGHGMPMVAFSPDGRLASGDQEGITVYDPDFQSLVRLACPDAVVITTTFTPDGDHVAAGCFDGVVRFWELP